MTIKTFQNILATSTSSSRMLTSLRKIADVEASERDGVSSAEQSGWYTWG
jgi:hypothetical protein